MLKPNNCPIPYPSRRKEHFSSLKIFVLVHNFLELREIPMAELAEMAERYDEAATLAQLARRVDYEARRRPVLGKCAKCIDFENAPCYQ